MSDTPRDEDMEFFQPGGVSRRSLMQGAAAIAGATSAFVTQDVFAMADTKKADSQQADDPTNQTASEHARPTQFDPSVYKLPRWVPDYKAGAFDLTNPLDNHYAFAKAQANLAGELTWLAQYGWICICPPGKPPYPFLGRLTMAQVFATPAIGAGVIDDAGPHDYVLYGTFTTTHVDPRTFEPVTKLKNPYTGKTIEPPTFHYADRLAFRFGKSIVVPGVDPAFYDQPWDRDGGYSQHFIDAGDEITYTVLGASQLTGPQQPRLDVGFWSVTRDDLMNPSLRSIDTRRDYSVIQKMTEYGWYGAPKGDPAQLLVHLTGMKTQNIARLPKPVKEHILRKNMKRYGF